MVSYAWLDAELSLQKQSAKQKKSRLLMGAGGGWRVGSTLEGHENDSVHPHVSDALKIGSFEIEGQTLTDVAKKNALSVLKVTQFPQAHTFPGHALAT